MAITFRTESIVIKKEPWREFDRLYTLYTLEAGKIQAIAKGSRKSLSRMAAHLEPFLITDVMIARGRQIDRLAGSDEVANYRNLNQSIEKVALLSYCFEILDKLTSYGQADGSIFRLVKDLLEIADENHLSHERTLLLSRVFVLKLLSLLGYEPELYECLACKRRVNEEAAYFNTARGGIICPECFRGLGNGAGGHMSLAAPVIESLRDCHAASLRGCLELYLLPEVVGPLEMAMDDFLKYHLDGEVKSERYFYQVFA